MMILPKARTANLVEQNLEKETLIYDLLIDKAFNLNETSTIVYKACNGVTTFDELKRKYKFSDEFIFLALDELKRSDLLAKESVYVSPFANVNRREVIKKVGLASMFVLPIISGIVAPKAINAASNTGDDSPPSSQFGGYCRDQPGGPFCDNANGYFCSNNRCCVGNSGSYLPGETFTLLDFGVTGTAFYPINGSCDNPPDSVCEVGGCCNGETATPTSDCDIRPNYYDDAQTELGGCYVPTCTCTCR